MIDPVIQFTCTGLLVFGHISLALALLGLAATMLWLTGEALGRLWFFARMIWRVPSGERGEWVGRQLTMMRRRRDRDDE